MDQRDKAFLRRSFEVARRAVEHGNLPFGAILVDGEGEVVLESENQSITEHDLTAHAEVMLMHAAARRFVPEYLNRCTMYSSAEPCPMCAARCTGLASAESYTGSISHRLMRRSAPIRSTPHLTCGPP